MEEKIFYRLNDDISFRKCSLYDSNKNRHGNCTNYSKNNFNDSFSCNQNGIHLHCTKHLELEFNKESNDYDGSVTLICPKCKKEINIESLKEIYSQCEKLLNIDLFKGAKLIRLDDWYVPEVKKRVDTESNYWITTNVKTDKDGDTIVIIYIGHRNKNEKVQFFIKPEKCQLSNDHKDLDPASILSKIEITLKDRTLIQKYDDN